MKRYPTINLNDSIKLIHGDCLDEMKDIPSGSVDMVMADPPYGISRDSGISNSKLDKYKSISLQFGEWDNKGLDLDIIASNCHRILRDGGVVVLFYDIWASGSVLSSFNKFKQPRIIRWDKTNPVPLNSKLNFLSNATEYAFSFVKKSKPVFNSEYNNGVIRLPICHGKERTIHPTQKPVALMEYLIKTYTNEGETVLDFTFGSLTTGVACANLNRNMIGIEKDSKYFNLGVNRLKEHIKCQNLKIELVIDMAD